MIDALRVLRAADVLRQRGTVLRTSGGFELCIDAATARAVCTLRPAGGDAAYVISYDDPRCAGEANISVAFVTPQGHLRIAFHRGAFGDDEAASARRGERRRRVLDIEADVIPSFGGPTVAGACRRPTRSVDDIQIQLERPDDRPAFADDVARVVAGPRPVARPAARPGRRRRGRGARRSVAGSTRPRPSMPTIPRRTRSSASWPTTARTRRRSTGRRRSPRCAGRRSAPARSSSRRARRRRSSTSRPARAWSCARTAATRRRRSTPWVPVGTTGVIRRAERNSEIVAEREVDVIMIPGELYARAWLKPLRVDELLARLSAAPARARV